MKVKRYLMLITMVVGMLLSAAIPATAYTEGAAQQDTPGTGDGTSDTGGASDTEDAPLTEETPDADEGASEDGTPFSISGNGQLVDDLEGDGSKQFLTIRTENGNTFFMVLDRSNNTENVYMLSMIDEDDLAEFIRDGEKEKEQPALVLPETESVSASAGPEASPGLELEPEEERDGLGRGPLLAAAILLAGVAGVIYYLRVVKPKKEEDGSYSEDLEFFDGGSYVNEDREGTDDEEAGRCS